VNDELLKLLSYELGEILRWEKECLGVYYLSVRPEDGIGREYYAVFEDAPVSREARAMGRRLKSVPALVYPMGLEDGPQLAVKYEVFRYKIKHGFPLPEGDSLREAALYGMELCPEYFGTYPVPPVTPWGYTLRHRPLDSGIYWIETDQCVEVLAVCHPVWATELSEGLLGIAGKLECEGVMGYRYFLRQTACVAIFELLRTRPELTELGLIRKAELMNAIWEHQPGYAMGYNAQEQAGLHDAVGLLLYALGVEDRELEGSTEHMVTMDPKTGSDFIGFWK